jgi:hypothetical protein
MSSCPPPVKMRNDDIATSADKLAESMGATACKTDSTTVQASARIGNILGSMSMAVGGSSATTVGCEQLIAMAEKNDVYRNDIVCILKKTQANNKANVYANNTINIESETGDVTIACNELKFKQSMEIDLVMLSNLSEQDKVDISNVTKNAVKSMTDVLQDSKAGLGSTPQGAKMVKDLASRNQTQDFKQQVDESIREISIDVSTSNTINIKAKKNIRLTGKSCEMNQNIVLNIVASLILDSVIEKNFSSMGNTMNESVMDVEQKGESEGAENIGKPPPEPTNITAIIVIIVICLCVAGLAYMFISGGGLEIAGDVATKAIAKM